MAAAATYSRQSTRGPPRLIPLPVTVDSERIRKLVKKIGLEMVADPEFARVIDVPLKAKLYLHRPPDEAFFRVSFDHNLRQV
jgi:hypothetical protein